jgi:hypothetical protein
VRLSLVESLLKGERDRQIIVRVGESWRPAVAVDRGVQVSLRVRRIAEVVVRGGIFRVDLDCPAVASNRLVQFALADQRMAQVIIGVGIVGAELESAPVTFDRFGQLARGAVCEPQVYPSESASMCATRWRPRSRGF